MQTFAIWMAEIDRLALGRARVKNECRNLNAFGVKHFDKANTEVIGGH